MSKDRRPVFSYLPLYNLASAIGWGYILYLVLLQYPKLGQPRFYQDTKDIVTYIQCGAIIEILNSLFGIVRSPLLTTAAQVLSRLVVVLGIFQYLPEARNAHGIVYITLLLSWSITEIIRYMFYFFTLIGSRGAPTFLVYLRYNLFLVLYPTGVASELLIIYSALPVAEAKYSLLWKRFLIGVMLTYLPGLPMLFLHMLAQRRKIMKQLANKTQKQA
ncbi:uncharacterized protein GVI51_L03377 [Nakaseomyces glabratus]|uniref:Very-long-chain (3R)-3-hydroxyacyl-CoA dehydratase n=2 Tax=Candida glabrata TaxID=5478 RepID=Q6FLG6_CANGA|nr:uncharacterized protein CAGL0L03564g [Nakaseomyces glabratus]KAH7581419.1 Protein tyrosine phosphatase-like protein, PTPLA [Nakaseomyces glabratus]KAH7594981.1 Protein tyrosine phosphatase-like protein, PTPLA [Nakaseomyces glabratus]KAH7595408.1 Protein tyrosine phosphatase-like protein, PTPLA [Nakaseomyces glabratus]KAH7601840.1 Protein tyrosine phosphatase-like protein, PTPLA [Nakaseomyces glabratus]KAH7611064.1 Protein tyrosine phosphatase-like protein, PTPLA [Nakaseomyces glabratus]|eukprot:XP_448928.1 uncharacterized protein CAGL0L03564g [[Candida] glabrata]